MAGVRCQVSGKGYELRASSQEQPSLVAYGHVVCCRFARLSPENLIPGPWFSGDLRDVLPLPRTHYTALMAAKPASQIRCAQCEQLESRCWCEKFCILCQSQLDVRLCTDG